MGIQKDFGNTADYAQKSYGNIADYAKKLNDDKDLVKTTKEYDDGSVWSGFGDKDGKFIGAIATYDNKTLVSIDNVDYWDDDSNGTIDRFIKDLGNGTVIDQDGNITPIPEPVIPEPTIPEPTIPDPAMPQSLELDPTIPEPTIPDPIMPEPINPEPTNFFDSIKNFFANLFK